MTLRSSRQARTSLQVVRLGQLAVQIFGVLRVAPKPRVVVRRCMPGSQAFAAAIVEMPARRGSLDQPILQRAKRALDAALGLHCQLHPVLGYRRPRR